MKLPALCPLCSMAGSCARFPRAPTDLPPHQQMPLPKHPPASRGGPRPAAAAARHGCAPAPAAARCATRPSAARRRAGCTASPSVVEGRGREGGRQVVGTRQHYIFRPSKDCVAQGRGVSICWTRVGCFSHGAKYPPAVTGSPSCAHRRQPHPALQPHLGPRHPRLDKGGALAHAQPLKDAAGHIIALRACIFQCLAGREGAGLQPQVAGPAALVC